MTVFDARYASRLTARKLTLITAILVALTACDQAETRRDRAETLIDAAIEQFQSGGALPTGLESVSPEERAIAGRLTDAAAQAPTPSERRYMPGSIIGKPSGWDEARALETNQSGGTGQSALSTSETIRLDAEAVLLQTMDRLGLTGDISSTYNGEFILQIDGTLGSSDTAPDFATETEVDSCEDVEAAESLSNDLARATHCLIEALEQTDSFDYLEKNYLFQAAFIRAPQTTSPTPDDPLWALQWNLQNPGSNQDRSPGGAGFEAFWQQVIPARRAKVAIAMIDTGLVLNHPDFEGSLQLKPGWDMISDLRLSNDGDGRDESVEDTGASCDTGSAGSDKKFHGTHIAGLLGAALTSNRQGIAGATTDAALVPVRALGACGGQLSDLNDAIRWAGGLMPAAGANGAPVWNENPADIINLPIALAHACPASLQSTIDAVVERGAIVVAAAGNTRSPASSYSPASCNNVITVAASDARGDLTSYSNYGDAVDILAPGGALDRDDNEDGHPDGILSTKPAEACLDPMTGASIERCDYAFEEGTSLAAAHVSAAFALLKSVRPDLTRVELIEAMIASARPLSDEQCIIPCEEVSDDTCARSCGAGLLDLTNLSRINRDQQ